MSISFIHSFSLCQPVTLKGEWEEKVTEQSILLFYRFRLSCFFFLADLVFLYQAIALVSGVFRWLLLGYKSALCVEVKKHREVVERRFLVEKEYTQGSTHGIHSRCLFSPTIPSVYLDICCNIRFQVAAIPSSAKAKYIESTNLKGGQFGKKNYEI